MRGPQPDAECPRCNHRQPPSGALVTCLKCGLAFPPKELQHRASKPSRPPEAALVLVRPIDLEIDTDGESLTFRWTDNGLAGIVAIVSCTILGTVVWTSMMSIFDKLGYSGFLVAFLTYGLFQARRRPRVHLDRNQIKSATGTLLLADISRIDVDAGRITAVTRYGKSHEIATTSDPKIAAYVGSELARRIGQTD